MEKITRKRVVVSLIEDGEKVYIEKSEFLGSPSVCKTVPLEEATLFDNPRAIQNTLDKFAIPNPKLEVVEVTVAVRKAITSESEKYELFAELSRAEEKVKARKEARKEEGK